MFHVQPSPAATAATPTVLALIGPTASGKTGLALALAAQWPVEIISVDSALVYRDMNIGTAKPSAQELAQVPHHLIDCISPEHSYSAARFVADSLACMADIQARGRIPLLVGGTMLYYRALEQGLSDLPAADAAVRAELDAQAAQLGWPALHARLQQLDPVTAARLAPTDSQRIQRALEICLLSGRPMSALAAPEGPNVRLLKLALVPSDRLALHRRIGQRFDHMLAQGLIEETAQLRRQYQLHPDLPSMRCVGYRQAWSYLEGEIDRATCREQGLAATRQLAKRQLTWLRPMSEVLALDCMAPDLLEQGLRVAEQVLAHAAAAEAMHACFTELRAQQKPLLY